MKTYRCSHCNEAMDKIDEIHLGDGRIKYGVECKKHPGITYYVIEKLEEKKVIGLEIK